MGSFPVSDLQLSAVDHEVATHSGWASYLLEGIEGVVGLGMVLIDNPAASGGSDTVSPMDQAELDHKASLDSADPGENPVPELW